MEMIGRSSGHFEKNLLHLQVRVAPPLCRKARFATKGEEGEGCKENTGTKRFRATIKPGFYLHSLLNGFACAIREMLCRRYAYV